MRKAISAEAADHRKERYVSNRRHSRPPWFLWPFVALWDLLTFILNLTGRLAAAILGLALMIVGAALTVTLIAAPVGIPIIVFGLTLIVRGLF
jgi:hypothetical protein